jgi:hypothetical protein
MAIYGGFVHIIERESVFMKGIYIRVTTLLQQKCRHPHSLPATLMTAHCYRSLRLAQPVHHTDRHYSSAAAAAAVP